jgi:hypothetical protein
MAEEVKTFLRWKVDLREHEAVAFLSKCGWDVGLALDRLDAVRNFKDLGALGLVHGGMSDKEIRMRFARVKHGADDRECLRKFLKHSEWAAKHGVTRRDLESLSLLEWEIAEAGNPWIMVPVLVESKKIKDVVPWISIGMEFAKSALPKKAFADDDTVHDLLAGAFYAWVRDFVSRRQNSDRILVEVLQEAFYEKNLQEILEWDLDAIESFDPSLGKAQQSAWFNHDLNAIGLGEVYSEACARCARTVEKPTLRGFNAFRRLANEIVFTPHPSCSDQETNAKTCVAWRESWLAERELFQLLDAIQDQSLVKKERDEQLAKVVEAAHEAVRVKERKTLAGRAGGLSLVGESSSSEDDEE